jgi:hypothetical protein
VYHKQKTKLSQNWSHIHEHAEAGMTTTHHNPVPGWHLAVDFSTSNGTVKLLTSPDLG